MENLLDRLSPVLAEWWQPAIIVCYFIGAFLLIVGLNQYANPLNQNRRGSVFATILVGLFLLNFPTIMDTLAYTIFNTGSEQTLSYSPPSHPGRSYVQLAVWATMFIGLIGIARGCVLLRAAGHGQPQIGRSVTHFIGGAVAVNIVQFLHLIGGTFGGEVESTINFVFG